LAFLCLVHGVEGGEERMVGGVVPPVSQVQSAHKGGQGRPRVIPHCAYTSPSFRGLFKPLKRNCNYSVYPRRESQYFFCLSLYSNLSASTKSPNHLWLKAFIKRRRSRVWFFTTLISFVVVFEKDPNNVLSYCSSHKDDRHFVG
jgi:hypothetical protein